MANEKYANARHAGEQRFTVETGAGHHTLTLDGDGQAGPSPMDLLLAGLAGCTGIDVTGILAKMRQPVTGLEIRVRGLRAQEYPQVYIEIFMDYIVTGHGVSEEAVARAVELSETRYCSVGAMLGKTATITHSITLRDAEPAGPATPAESAPAPAIGEPAESAATTAGSDLG